MQVVDDQDDLVAGGQARTPCVRLVQPTSIVTVVTVKQVVVAIPWEHSLRFTHRAGTDLMSELRFVKGRLRLEVREGMLVEDPSNGERRFS